MNNVRNDIGKNDRPWPIFELSDFEQVKIMYEHFGFIERGQQIPHLLDDNLTNFKLHHLHEELTELQTAYANKDLPEVADALVDLVVVVMGLAAMHGLPWEDLFDRVHQANMSKQVGTGKRGHTVDLIKPEGWKKPDLSKVLLNHGWVP